MDENSVNKIIAATYLPRAMAALALGTLALFLLIASVNSLKSYMYIGSGVAATNTIDVSGVGEVFAVPDTATFSFTVMQTAKDVKAAQDAMVTKANAIMDYVKGQGIDEKDIQTIDYSVNPHYTYEAKVCPANGYCPPGNQIISGYDVSESVSVKVRDAKKAGTLLSGVGERGASNVSGLSFTIDDQDALEAQARDKAIGKARDKANVLAKSLGVSIVRVVGFNENAGGNPYFAKTRAMSADAGVAPSAPPEIATGQNKIISNVDVVYEIR
jgi:uncharacterized protein YggE